MRELDYPHIQQVNICTDNDAGGYEAYERIADTLHEMGYKRLQRFVSQYKDWNEDLKSLNGDTPIPAAIHKHKALFLQESVDLCFYPVDEKMITSDIETAYNSQQWQCVAESALAEAQPSYADTAKDVGLSPATVAKYNALLAQQGVFMPARFCADRRLIFPALRFPQIRAPQKEMSCVYLRACCTSCG